MVDKFVDSQRLDSDLTRIANAIRSKRNIETILSFPEDFITEINNIYTVSASDKYVTVNGIYLPQDDDVDVYSSVEVAVHAGLITPLHFDIDTGYVMNDAWNTNGITVNYSDVYEVTANERYLLCLGAIVGTRFRACYLDTDPLLLTDAKTPGTRVSNLSNPDPYASQATTAPSDGYLVVTKDNAGTANIKSFLFSITGLVNGNS